MTSDEQEIRQLVARWMSATEAGDVDTILGLMSEDAVFLVPGRAPMRKPEFAAQARAQAGPAGPAVVGRSEIQEVQVLGDWAFMWSRLEVTVSPPGGAEPIKRSGHTLTVFKKESCKWLLARDANMLAPVPSDRQSA